MRGENGDFGFAAQIALPDALPRKGTNFADQRTTAPPPIFKQFDSRVPIAHVPTLSTTLFELIETKQLIDTNGLLEPTPNNLAQLSEVQRSGCKGSSLDRR